ncbi:phosphoribosylglycinamide formyltransferase [Candidatus Methylospira mobilis]|uniref:Phosphoribosylglycinamide formyltransferase n=1 Tax=Candidatus Methylospira mobilis TaxID=1808979 RepID=A0A5Q0BRI6_9GAMM|nr:phosphoribosylglycinamide formyltransferase [Candidatus Methylospira mobilis]QFY44687.1 phosphoribosylglycinamide formyltransferase [Candidatus Methylospira mobilis]WNV05775.1 phosphoribosylglycinamide formyltransferase [Candidatus Methylospira mobilis]
MKLAFLASHNGSNMQAVIDACNSGKLACKPVLVISNNRESGALARAQKEGIPSVHLSLQTHRDTEALDHAILAALQQHGADWVVLAGYMRKLGAATLSAYRGRIVNIHPALLPKFGGQGMYGINVHRAVLAAGEAESGATVHLVDGEYDHGEILAQRKVPVLPDDTPETLAQRVLNVEHQLYVDTLAELAAGMPQPGPQIPLGFYQQ